jgi:F-type H+-transporting ATPase subunit epsilon
MSIHLEIVTPEARVFPGKDDEGHVISGEVDSVVLPGTDGELGILPSHVPLVTTLKPGELAYTKGNKTEYFAVGTGFVEVTGERVCILTDMAQSEEDIDEKAVEEALKLAEQRLIDAEKDTTPEEVSAVQAMIQKSMAQLHVKRRRRSL